VRGFGLPHASQVLQVTRTTRTTRTTGRWQTTTVYAVTRLAHAAASPPGSLTSSTGTGRSRTAYTTCSVSAFSAVLLARSTT
jgi:hypothetical protein